MTITPCRLGLNKVGPNEMDGPQPAGYISLDPSTSGYPQGWSQAVIAALDDQGGPHIGPLAPLMMSGDT